jgi:septum formation topological specificity factor MinE
VANLWAGGGTYDQWAAYLETWAAGARDHGEHLPRLREQDFPSDGWERIGNRLTGALSQRLKGWAEALTRAVGECGSEFEVGRALAQARDGLREARRLTQHPGLPPEMREKLLQIVDRQVESAQNELERQVDRMRRAGTRPEHVEARLRTLRDNRLTAVLAEQAGGGGGKAPGSVPAHGSPGWALPPGTSARRRIIVD